MKIEELNILFQIIGGLFLVIGGICSFFRWVLPFSKKSFHKSKQTKIIRDNFEDFKYYITKFEEFVNIHGRENIAAILYEIDMGKNEFGESITFLDKIIEKGVFYGLHDFYKFLSCRAKSSPKSLTIDELKFLINTFNSLVGLFNSLICDSVNKIVKISKDKIPSYSQEQYRKLRNEYVYFIKDYTNFGEKINQKMDEKIFRVYFEYPPDNI